MPVQDSAPTTKILSLESHKRNNIAYIEDDVLVTSAGNNVVFLHLPDLAKRYMAGLDGGGIGAIAVHPSRKFLAVAEKCRHRAPNVYVYSYPQLALVKVKRKGREGVWSRWAIALPPSVCRVYSHPQVALFDSARPFLLLLLLLPFQVMREGTEHAYSALSFNDKGDMLASVGGHPDYLLTLWNWEEESIVLRSKAFSQVRGGEQGGGGP